MLAIFSAILLSMLVVMAAGWAYQRAARNGGWTDVFWTYGTGLVCAAAALTPYGDNAGIAWRRMMVAAIVAIWALRLGTYVALRVAHGSEDVRYATLRQEWGRKFQSKMFGLLIVQAPITALLSLAILYAARHPEESFRLWDGLGLAILAVAIGGETIADRQMKRFKADIKNKGKVCDTGLWGWSRHPNYFFEAIGWVAYPVIALDIDNPWTALSLIAPVLMYVVLRYLTGVPALETAMVKSKGEAYRRYQQRVSSLLPLPPNGSGRQ